MKFTTFAVDGKDIAGHDVTLYWATVARANLWNISVPHYKPKTDKFSDAYKYVLTDYGDVYEVEVEYVPETLDITRL